MQVAQTFPVHPQPMKNESMTSWMARLAESNGTSLRSVLSSYYHNNRWDRRDLDYLEVDDLDGLLMAARVEDTCFRPTTFHNVDKLFDLDGEDRISFR